MQPGVASFRLTLARAVFSDDLWAGSGLIGREGVMPIRPEGRIAALV